MIQFQFAGILWFVKFAWCLFSQYDKCFVAGVARLWRGGPPVRITGILAFGCFLLSGWGTSTCAGRFPNAVSLLNRPPQKFAPGAGMLYNPRQEFGSC